MTTRPPLRPLNAMEKRAVALAHRGVPEAAISLQTRLTADQIAVALDRHQQWERLGWGAVTRTPKSPAPPAPTTPAPTGPTPQERAVQLYAGGMGINQVSVATGLTRAKVREALGLEPDGPRHLVPDLDLPPVLQGIDGSITDRRPAVVATPKTPVVQPPRPCRAKPSPAKTRPWEDPARSTAERTRVARAMDEALHRRPASDQPAAPAVAVVTAPAALLPGSRAWKRLATSDDVRDWATRDGWILPPPGDRLPGAIILAYHRAHGGAL